MGDFMQITPETKKISEIFPIVGDASYKIPLYQRHYSWNNEQINQLFEDIDKESDGYYIGNLLVTSSGKKNSTLEIVDGQQRLTTLSLFY